MSATAITEAIEQIAALDEISILEGPWRRDHESRWSIKVRIAPNDLAIDSLVPGETDWYIRIDPTYPAGNIGFYPAKENGIVENFPHQTLNTSGNSANPWRTGDICVNRYTHSLDRLGGFEDPFDAEERLRWYCKRAIKWLKLASNGELRQEGDPYELPAFNESRSRVIVGYSETRSSFQTWSDSEADYGLTSLSNIEETRSWVVTEFYDLDKDSVYSPDWGDMVDSKEVIEGAWIRLDEVPIQPPWTVPETWEELAELLPSPREQLYQPLVDLRLAYPDSVFSFVLLGFPIPEFVGDCPQYMHWQAIRVDDFPKIDDLDGFRTREKPQYQILKLSIKYDSISWVESDNWAQSQLLRRGKLDPWLRESNLLVIGAGALGSLVAETIVRDGCRNLTIVDGDDFEIGNLARHTLDIDSIDQKKADELADRMSGISPHVNVTSVSSKYPLSEEDWNRVPNPDVILDCTGSDRVLQALDSQQWDKPKWIVSVSLAPQGQRVYIYSSRTNSFDLRDFQEKHEPWAERDVSDHRPGDDIVHERVGCWHPVSVIAMHSITTWAGLIPEVIQQRVNLGEGESKLDVLETSNSQTEVSINHVKDPFPEVLSWTSMNGVRIEIPASCLQEMVEYFSRATPNETGGILTGTYTNGSNARVIRATDPPPDSIEAESTFVRGTEQVDEALKDLHERFGIHYIGEWHTHPRGYAELSKLDAKEMQAIADDEGYECPYPFLTILGSNRSGEYTIKSYMFRRDGVFDELIPLVRKIPSNVTTNRDSNQFVYAPSERNR